MLDRVQVKEKCKFQSRFKMISHSSLSSCPVCRQTLIQSQIHKIYLSDLLNKSTGSMDDVIVQSLATTVAAEQKKTEAKFQEIR